MTAVVGITTSTAHARVSPPSSGDCFLTSAMAKGKLKRMSKKIIIARSVGKRSNNSEMSAPGCSGIEPIDVDVFIAGDRHHDQAAIKVTATVNLSMDAHVLLKGPVPPTLMG